MDIISIIFVFLFGACIGSFLNVVIWRLPRGESLAFPGSHCPSCGRAIRWYDNVPILSWCILRGKCRFCGVQISPRYLIVEAVTGLLMVGLWVCYYIMHVRNGITIFSSTWPTFIAHAILICGLLACSLIDIETFTVPLGICWFVALVGIVFAAVFPNSDVIPNITPAAGALGIGAVAGLIIALVLLHRGLMQPSFIDADYGAKNENQTDSGDGNSQKQPRQEHGVALSSRHGINPRKEILREILFLAPAIILGIGAYMLVKHVQPVSELWTSWHSDAHGNWFARHLCGFETALFGYLIGGLCVWGMRILGTLGFGKEAMGMGDVHIMAAVGAVTGWMIPTVAFFLAPIFGLLWAFYLLIRKNQHELPYGPWLSAASLAAMIFHDKIAAYFKNFGH
ncbi:MAG: prepilin peptidase [Phycisphaerae bacterium]|nr:prepilin peptidase [Phycisphaerae bacterium]